MNVRGGVERRISDYEVSLHALEMAVATALNRLPYLDGRAS